MILKNLFTISLLFLVSHSAIATLVWDQTTVEIQVDAGQPDCVVVFRYSNDGPNDITIQNIISDCDCVTVSFPRLPIKQGATGQVEVSVVFNGYSGILIRSVEVFTSDTASAAARLLVRAHIPAFATITPQLLVWSGKERGQAKILTLQLTDKSVAQLKQVTSDFPELHVTVQSVDSSNRGYQILVTPPAETLPRNATLTVEVKIEERIIPLPVSLIIR